MTNAKRKVLVAGAGIGGLAAALALLRSGFDCEVHEQATELREVGAGLWLSVNGTRIFQELGLEAELRAASIAADARLVRLWNTGEEMPLYRHGDSAATHQPFLLLRAHLLKILVDAVRREKPDAIHLNARCTGFRQDDDGAWLLRQDGSEIRGDVVIGADGVHSRIRDQVFGPVPSHYTNAIAWRGLVPMDRLSPHQRAHVVATWVGPNAHVTVYPVRWQGTDLLTFSGQVEHAGWQGESWSEKGAKADCLQDFAGWHADIVEMITAVDTLHKWGLFVRDPLPHWSEGRVTLVGDACHSMVPYLGQGVNMAVEDAWVLARCLGAAPGDPVAALSRYEAARRERTARVAAGAAAMQTVFHNQALARPETAMDYVRAQWSPAANAARYDWIYRYDAISEPLPAAALAGAAA